MYKYNYVYVILYGANYKNIKKTCFMILFFDRLHVLNLSKLRYLQKEKNHIFLYILFML